jgi:hypothetical protein
LHDKKKTTCVVGIHWTQYWSKGHGQERGSRTKGQEEKCLSSTVKAKNETKRVKEENGDEIGK